MLHRNPRNRRALSVSQIDTDGRSAQRELAREGKQACGCWGKSPLEVKPTRRWGVAWASWKAQLSSQDQGDHSERWRQGEQGRGRERLSPMVGVGGRRGHRWEVLGIILWPHPGPRPAVAEWLYRLGGICAPEAPCVSQEEPALLKGARSPHLPAGNLRNLGRGLGPRELWSELRGRNKTRGPCRSSDPVSVWAGELSPDLRPDPQHLPAVDTHVLTLAHMHACSCTLTAIVQSFIHSFCECL